MRQVRGFVMGPERPESLLPWGLPFRMVDRLIACVPHRSIDTLKRVTHGDAAGPGGRMELPALPEVMVLEGMGQSASLLHQMTYGPLAGSALPMLGFVKATQLAPARAGDTLQFTIRAVKMTTTMGLFEAEARIDGTLIAAAEFAMGVSAEPEGAVREPAT